MIFDNPWTDTTIALTAIANHVASGGKLIMSSYRVDSQPLNHLWALLGFAYANDQPNKVPLCIWQPGNPIFNLPNKYGATKFVPTRDYGDEGDLLMTFGNATSLAGNATTATTNKTNIVLRNDGKTLYNGYLIDQFKADYDNSSYKDNFELWENEIAFMLSPTIDSPSDIHYVVGATGNSIVWHPLSGRPFNYSLTINGSDAGIGPWAGSAITLNVDGLSVGNHTCLLKVWDNAGYSVSDSVLVTVTAMTTTPEGLSPTVIILIVAAAAIIVVLLVVFMRRGKK